MPFSDWLRNFNQLRASFHFAPLEKSREIKGINIQGNFMAKYELNLPESQQEKSPPTKKSLYERFRNYEI